MAYSEELMTILENRNNHISPKLKIELKEKEKKNELFYIENDNYILIPGNEISKKAQNIAFDDIEQMQLKLINEYESLDNINRIRKSNDLFSFIIKVFFNGDASALKAFSGYRGRTLLTDEELRNVKRDFKIAKEKKKNGEFLTFFMLDIFPGSDRRADAIILTTNYELELYDFSEGQVVAELNSFSGKIEELSESKQKQYARKERQQKRIDSYSKIVTPSADYLPGIKIQEETEGIKYTFLNSFNVYDFNFAYSSFLKEKRKKIFIPNSICFLMNKDDHAPFIFEFQLKMNIDHPHYVNERKNIDIKYIDDIYMYDTKIGLSWLYFNMYFEKFTNFEIVLKRKQTQFKGKMFEQFIIKEKNGRTKAVYLKDKRTGNEIPLSIGLIYKHIYANFSLKSWTIYMSKLCNQNINFPVINLEKFHEEIIKKEIDKNFKELRDIFLIDHP